jgi:GNAT superfamily N-acetyltransferase
MADVMVAAPEGAGAELHRAGGAVALRVPALPQVVEVNRVLGVTDLAELAELEPAYAGDRIVVSLDPETGLGPALAERGYAPGYPWHKFVRAAEPLAPRSDLSIEDARSPAHFGLAFARGFGLPDAAGAWMARLVGRPGWHCFVGYDGELPVSCGALFAAGETGWLGLGATAPEARGRGGQSGVLAARIARAAKLGLAQVVTETGAPRDDRPGPSYRNILRAGFEVAYERPNFVRG